MKSFIHCCSQSGIADWVHTPHAQEHALTQALRSCDALQVWAAPSPLDAASFALGRSQAEARPVAILLNEKENLSELSEIIQAAKQQGRSLLFIHCGESFESDNLCIPSLELTLPCTLSDLTELQDRLRENNPLLLHLQGDFSLPSSLEEISVAEPPAPPAFRGSLVALSQMLRFKADEGLLLMIGALDADEQPPCLWIAETLRAPVIADAASGLREELQDQMLHDASAILSKNPPRYVLRLGEVPQHDFWTQLETMPDVKVFSLTRTGITGLQRDSYTSHGEIEQIMKAVGSVSSVFVEPELRQAARKSAAKKEELLLRYPESKAALIHALSYQACMTEAIALSGNTIQKLWDQFAQLQYPTQNVYAFEQGYAAQIATFLGYSAHAERAFCFCDAKSLLSAPAKPSLSNLLPQGLRLIAVLNENEEQGCLKDLAEQWQARYIRIDCEADFDQIEELPHEAFVLMEICPDREQSLAVEQSLN